jgi:hypothetical protein
MEPRRATAPGSSQSKAHSETYFRRIKIGVANADINAIPSDLALVSAVRSGDQGAMATLYDRHSSIVYAVATWRHGGR